MRQTYGDLKTMFLNGTQNAGSTDTTLLSFFQNALDTKYQFVLAQLENGQTQVQKTASTVASQQYYHNPAGVVQIETVTVTVGTIVYPLTVISSQFAWDRLNEMLISTTAIPQFVFPRRDDFGIWPIPQGVYTITINYNTRDRKLTNDDYTTGNCDVTNNSQSVVGHSTVWTSAMIGRWFKFTPDGYWYRVSNVTSNTALTLETSFEGTTASGGAYVIGESPELPEEAHPLLGYGAIGDYFSLVRSDIQKGTWFNNLFFTGDGQNSDRTGVNVVGGLIGLTKRYDNRANSRIIKRMGSRGISDSKLWATKIS